MKPKLFKLLAPIFAILLAITACSSTRGGETTGGDSAGGGASASADGGGQAAGDTLIGIAMPTKSLERWNKDGAHLEQLLKDKGYQTTLQYADNKVDQQITQIQNMINQNPKVLVVASIDGSALAPVLQTAADAGIVIIAYDRLINDTENVDYYATFDNYRVVQLQGEFIAEQNADMEKPVTLEPFAGSPDDNNAKFFFSGAWDVINPMIESGDITVPSGKAPKTNDEWTQIGIQGWGSDTAQSEMQNRLNTFYAGGEKLDAVLSPNDSLALGIAQALQGAGYAPGDEYPILTGQDADKANVLNIIDGKQSMTVWKDTRELGDRVALMVEQIVNGEEVEVNDTESYNNNVKNVPTFLLEPVVVTADNIEDTLVDSGFYTKEDLGL